MTSNANSLCAVVTSLQGQDIEKMADQQALDFKRDAMDKFVVAAADLPRLLFPCDTDFNRLVWSVSPAEPYCLEWIGTFRLRAADLMEANLGQSRLVAMAAALFPELELRVELMGDYHYPGGLNSVPSVEIAIRVADGDAFDALQAIDPLVCSRFESLARAEGVKLRVRTVEDAMDDQVQPPSLQCAITAAIAAARDAAEAECQGEAEVIDVRLVLAGGVGLTPQILVEACTLMGQLFAHCDAASAAV